MSKSSGSLFIGIGGHVVAIDRARGTEIWRTKLKASSYVTICQSGAKLYAGANGTLFCLDPATGNILWKNGLKGLGLGIIAFGGSDEIVSGAALIASEQAAAS